MKIKLRLERADGQPAIDLSIAVDPTTTIGDLADRLARSDPSGATTKPGDQSIMVIEPKHCLFRSDSSLADAGLRSGTTVALVSTEQLGAVDQETKPAATVAVVAGPDSGKEFPLFEGTSYIGRSRTCEVHLSDPMTSRRHAKLVVGETVEVSDAGSVNGILIGDSEVDGAILRSGDTVRLGDTVLAVQFASERGGTARLGNVVSFNRAPQISGRYEGRSFAMPEAPVAPKGQRFPIIPLFAPLLMGSALYLTTKSTTSLIFMGMSPLMMAGNVIEGLSSGKRTYARELQDFRLEVGQLREQVTAEVAHEASARCAELPDIASCATAIRDLSPLLWSRRPGLFGFGRLRLGTGRQPSRLKFDYPFARQGKSPLTGELHEEFDLFTTIDGVPVSCELDDDGVVGVAGHGDPARGVARSFVLQLTALHSPAELAVYSLCGAERAEDWEWLKWLPHCGAAQTMLDSDPLVSVRTACTNLVGQLSALIQSRLDAGRSAQPGPLPRVLLVVDSPATDERSRLIEVAKRGRSAGVWVLWVADDLGELPSCCESFVVLGSDGRHGRASFVSSSTTIDQIRLDPVTLTDAEDLARTLAPVVDAAVRDDSQGDVPRGVSLLTLVGPELAASPDRVVERWVENSSVLTGPRSPTQAGRGRSGNLRAVIGEGAAGPHVLDLRVHGPHALVGGTTGAGKSELLQTWIVGMALTNSPQRLTFLLVDYKGGSAFSDCVKLPHTVGLVTDLSPHLVRRALTSLSAELRYREHILHRKRAKDLVSLERVGDPDAPPSLVIVVDEFAALVKEVPEFVDGVVNVAQRGRSLGLHLILATQRPSGVIRDNLRANTNLRIALRMADAADSTDVIGTKAAAAFDPAIPGRAASRTGPTALVPFQTGYVGGWTSFEPAAPDIQISTFGFAPKTTWELPADDSVDKGTDGPTDIQRLVSSIGEAARLTEIATPRKPWLAELAHVYDLGKLPSRRRDDQLVFAVGDDPENQAQPTVAFHPDDDGNMAIFGTGNSGKTTLLRTLGIAAGITVRGGPCHVYGLDFGSRGLQMLEQFPHVGSIIAGTDTERASRLLNMLREMIDERAIRYSHVGAGSVTQYRTVTGSLEEPRILLLIDGMGAMRSAYEGTEHHRLFETFLSIAGDGRQVGIHVLIAADRAGAVPSALGALIQRRVILRLAGENEYAMFNAPNDVLGPKSPPGRGLCDGMEIQVALLGKSSDLLAQDNAIKALADAMRSAGISVAQPVKRLEEQIDLDSLPVDIDGKPAFAVASETLSGIGYLPEGTFTVAGPPGSGRTTTLVTLVESWHRWRADARLILFGSRRSPLANRMSWDRSSHDAASAAALARELPEFLGEAGGTCPPGIVVIENLADFVQSEADAALVDMIKKVTSNGHLVVSDGEPMPLSGLQPLLQVARSSRVGLVLQPEQSDGNLLRTQFPRLRKADFPPGRALYVARGELPTVVQVAHAGSPTH